MLKSIIGKKVNKSEQVHAATWYGMLCYQNSGTFFNHDDKCFSKEMFFLFPLNKNRYIWKNKDKKKKIIALTHAIWISSFTCMRSQKYHLLVYNTKNEKKKKKLLSDLSHRLLN
jgi:hypothetical protein